MAEGPADRIGRHIKHISADVKRYMEKRLELLALNVGEQYARWVAHSVQKMMGAVLLFAALAFLLIALALYVGGLLGSRSLGFVLVSIPLIIGGYLLFTLRPRSVTRRIRAEFEEELVDIFQVAHRDEHNGKLITDSQELEQNNDQDVEQK